MVLNDTPTKVNGPPVHFTLIKVYHLKLKRLYYESIIHKKSNNFNLMLSIYINF